jgi:hypothetical protein
MVMLVRSAVTHEESTRMLREFVTEQMLGRLAAGMDTADRASADPETVVAAVAPTLQRYLTGSIE